MFLGGGGQLTKQSPLPPLASSSWLASAPGHSVGAVFAEATTALDPIRSLGAQLWVTQLAPFGGQRRYLVDGWISDWRRRAGNDATSVGFAFELEGTRVREFHVLVRARMRPFSDVKTIADVVRKLRVAIKISQSRIVLVEPSAPAV
jgi:hypothetical protein